MLKKIIIRVGGALVILVFLGLLFLWLRIENKPLTIVKKVSNVEQVLPPLIKGNANQWLTSLNQHKQIPSISAAIGVNGKLAWAGAIGYSDIKNTKLADINSLYRIGSISKSMTAFALMGLEQKNIINLGDTFQSYVNDFAENKPKFTIRQLANHQAGVRHYKQGIAGTLENLKNTEYIDTQSAADVIKQDDLLFEPGTNFNYSTYGYTLLALSMEQAANNTFKNIMHEEVFGLLNMHTTYFDRYEKDPTKTTTPYLAIKNSLIKAPETNLSYKYAGGGYLSTPSDLVKFGNALLTNQYLSEESITSLWTPIPLDNGQMNPENYGLGFRIGADEFGRYIHHGGKSVGGYAYLVIYPDLDIVIAITANVTPMGFIFDRHKEAKKLLSIFRE